ncbi:NAD(P)H-dependent oxidoreductase subunit E [Bacteroidota bacterium]
MERIEILKQFEKKEGNLLNILHAFQNNNPQNNLNQDDLKEVANYLNITYSHVYGVASYYTMFSLKPRGKYIIRVCNSPVCNMEKSTELINEIGDLLAINVGETTPDKRFTLELSECLGRCDTAPGMMINDDVIGNLDLVNLNSIFEKYK